MISRGDLVRLALGADNAARVDFAIPQSVFDGLSPSTRDDVAGWYYEPGVAPTFGRLLTQTECWRLIRAAVERGDLFLLSRDDVRTLRE